VREEPEGRGGRRLLEPLADRVDQLGEGREAKRRHLGLDLLLELLAEADVAVDRVEVRMVGMDAGAAEDRDERDREEGAPHDPPVLAERAAARTSARMVLGWTATRAPAASTSSRRPPPSWPVRLSPFAKTAVAFSPPSANSTRSTCFASRSVGRLPTFSRRGPKAPDTRRLSPLRITARKLASPAGALPARRLSCSICSTARRCVRPPAAIAMPSFSTQPGAGAPFASTTRASPRSPLPKRMLATAARGRTS